MSLLDEFEKSGKEVHEVTKQEWVDIMIDHYKSFNQYNTQSYHGEGDKIEFECFHKEQIERALRNNIIVDENILKDYPQLKEKIQRQIEKEQSVPIFTEDIYNTIVEGQKIVVNGHYKLTVYKKFKNGITARLYRSKKKAVDLLIGNRYTIELGW